jgi:hypothetical protein
VPILSEHGQVPCRFFSFGFFPGQETPGRHRHSTNRLRAQVAEVHDIVADSGSFSFTLLFAFDSTHQSSGVLLLSGQGGHDRAASVATPRSHLMRSLQARNVADFHLAAEMLFDQPEAHYLQRRKGVAFIAKATRGSLDRLLPHRAVVLLCACFY